MPVPPDVDHMTIVEWRDTPEVDKWMREHREHAGCTGISLMPNQARRLEQIDPDAMALRMVQRLAIRYARVARTTSNAAQSRDASGSD